MFFIMPEKELYHHGVLGMKWGVRNYQNPDGSLKAAGKKHVAAVRKAKYNHDVKKAVKKKTASMKDEHKKEIDRLNEEHAKELAKVKADSRANDPNTHEIIDTIKIKDMSDKELSQAISRLRNEQMLKDLMSEPMPSKSDGSKIAKKMTKGGEMLVDGVMQASKNAAKDYVEKELKKALGLNDDPNSLDLLDTVGINNLSDKQRASVKKAASDNLVIQRWQDTQNSSSNNTPKSYNYTQPSDSYQRRRTVQVKKKVGKTRYRIKQN